MIARAHLFRGGGLALATLLAGCGETVHGPEARNVILISLDTCRADRLSCYGAERPTPALDALAEEAVLFEDCLAQSCLTAPSHLSMLTGQFVHRHGLTDNGQVREPSVTLASVLSERGFRTAAFTGHGMLQAKYGHGKGFDVFESWIGPEPTEWPYWRRFPDVLPNALAWLDEAPADDAQPFFLMVHAYDPHQPYWPPEKWREKYASWYRGELDTRKMRTPHYKRMIQAGRLGEDERRYIRDLYDGEVAGADEALGGFLRELEDRGLLETSIVVFTSDHGEALGEHTRVGHGAMSETTLHVPLLMRFPGERYAGTREDPVMTVDLMPTVLSALRIEAPAGMQGIDLMPVIRDGEELDPGRMRLAQVKSSYTFRFGDRYKLYTKFEGDEVVRRELYDLHADPLERNDLARTPEGRTTFEETFDRFMAWRARTLEQDARFSGVGDGSISADDRALLEALGYVDDGG